MLVSGEKTPWALVGIFELQHRFPPRRIESHRPIAFAAPIKRPGPATRSGCVSQRHSLRVKTRDQARLFPTRKKNWARRGGPQAQGSRSKATSFGEAGCGEFSCTPGINRNWSESSPRPELARTECALSNMEEHELLPLFKKGEVPHLNNIELGKNGRWRSKVWS